jgi:hypothetical protein
MNHAMNLQDLFRQLFDHPRTLEDLGITEERRKQIMSATIDAWRDSLQNPLAFECVLSSQINTADAQHKEQEQEAAATSSAAIERKALEEAKARGPPAGHFKQIIGSCEPLDTIFLRDKSAGGRSSTSRCCHVKRAHSSVLDTGGGEGMAGLWEMEDLSKGFAWFANPLCAICFVTTEFSQADTFTSSNDRQ